IDNAAPHRDVTLKVSRGATNALRILSRSGAAVRGAEIVTVAGGVITGTVTTDDAGAASVKTVPGRDAIVYVLPTEGSFAIARLGSKAREGEQRIIVPDGNAALELHANDTRGKPIAHLRFVMRYDGELIPEDVANELERLP